MDRHEHPDPDGNYTPGMLDELSPDGPQAVTDTPAARALLLDDQPDRVRELESMLGDQDDITLQSCLDPDRAVQEAKSLKATVVLLDTNQGEADGSGILEKLKGDLATASIPVILLSDDGDPETKAQAFQAGASDYLVKPPHPVELAARVRLHSQSYVASVERDEAAFKLREYAQLLVLEQLRSEELLLNILPEQIADRLKDGEDVIADSFENVSVLFADLVNFSTLARSLTPQELVHLLNQAFSAFDELAGRHDLEKIKTIGDAYMVVSGVPEPRDDHAEAITAMGQGMLDCVRSLRESSGRDIGVRIGISSGPVTAGVIGKRKFIYDLWGDTVNIASRMESHGVEGRVHLSDATRRCLPDRFELEARGPISVKGQGLMETWLLAEQGSD
ncbi:MAG: adenylate/guanylate cyclase domain-containing protein [Acidobacteriota bacterium]